MGLLEEIIGKYVVEPILYKSGYNIVNTALYVIVLIAGLYAIRAILKRLKIKFDDNLWNDLLPFVFLGGILRGLEDVNFWNFLGVYHVFFITPLIYLLVFILALSSVLVSKFLWSKFTRYFGWAILTAFLVIAGTKTANLLFLPMLLSIFLTSYLVIFFAQKKLKLDIIKSFKSDNSQVLAGQLLDASMAFVSISLIGGYVESSLGSSMVFMHLPSWLFIPLKGVFTLLVLYVIDKESKENWNKLIKFTVLALGLGPAIHNIFTVLMTSV